MNQRLTSEPTTSFDLSPHLTDTSLRRDPGGRRKKHFAENRSRNSSATSSLISSASSSTSVPSTCVSSNSGRYNTTIVTSPLASRTKSSRYTIPLSTAVTTNDARISSLSPTASRRFKGKRVPSQSSISPDSSSSSSPSPRTKNGAEHRTTLVPSADACVISSPVVKPHSDCSASTVIRAPVPRPRARISAAQRPSTEERRLDPFVDSRYEAVRDPEPSEVKGLQRRAKPARRRIVVNGKRRAANSARLTVNTDRGAAELGVKGQDTRWGRAVDHDPAIGEIVGRGEKGTRPPGRGLSLMGDTAPGACRTRPPHSESGSRSTLYYAGAGNGIGGEGSYSAPGSSVANGRTSGGPTTQSSLRCQIGDLPRDPYVTDQGGRSYIEVPSYEDLDTDRRIEAIRSSGRAEVKDEVKDDILGPVESGNVYTGVKDNNNEYANYVPRGNSVSLVGQGVNQPKGQHRVKKTIHSHEVKSLVLIEYI